MQSTPNGMDRDLGKMPPRHEIGPNKSAQGKEEGGIKRLNKWEEAKTGSQQSSLNTTNQDKP